MLKIKTFEKQDNKKYFIKGTKVNDKDIEKDIFLFDKKYFNSIEEALKTAKEAIEDLKEENLVDIWIENEEETELRHVWTLDDDYYE